MDAGQTVCTCYPLSVNIVPGKGTKTMTKKRAFWRLVGAVALTAFFVFSWDGLRFNYDFENFFQQGDADLEFYQEYRSDFENDNDYLLLALGRRPTIFDSTFLEKALKLENKIREFEGVEEVNSLLRMEEPLIGPFGVSLRPLMDWSSPEALDRTSEKLSQDGQWQGSLISEDQDYLLLVIQNQQLIGKETGDSLFRSVEHAVRNADLPDYKIAGKIKAQGEFVRLLQEEFAFFLGLAGIWVLLLLWLLYRSWWAVLLPFVIIVLGVFWAGSFLLITGGQLDVMLVMQPPILMVIGLSGLVHFINHYQQSLRESLPKEKAVAAMCEELTLPIFLTALTTSLGFISLYFTNIGSLRWFGVYTGLGVLFMFFALITLLPGALLVFPALTNAENKIWARRWDRVLSLAYRNVTTQGKRISVVFVIVSLVAGYLMSQVKTDGYIVDSLPEDHTLKEDFRFFDQTFDGSKPLEIYLEVGNPKGEIFDFRVLQEIKKLAEFVGNNYNTDAILSPLTLVKAINKAQNRGNPNAYTLPPQGSYERMAPIMERWISENEWKLWTENLKSGRISARAGDVGSYIGYQQHADLKAFVANEINDDLLQVRLTGTSFLIDKSHEQVTQKVFSGLGFAFLLVVLVIGLLYKSWRVALVALLPNIIPLVWVGGAMFLLGVDFKLATSIVFAIAFGIAVDDSIHFLSSLRMQLAKGFTFKKSLRVTFFTTGKAIVLTTVVLSSGFFTLAFSDLEIPWFTGVLVGISLVFALLADLLWLPVLLKYLQKWIRKRTEDISQERQKLPR